MLFIRTVSRSRLLVVVVGIAHERENRKTKILSNGGTLMKTLMKSAGSVLIALMLMSSTVLADPLNDQLQGQQNQLKQHKDALQNGQEQLDTLEQKLQLLDEQIGSITNEIEKNKKLIVDTVKDIHTAENEVVVSEEELKKSNGLLDKRVRTMYKSGTNSYLVLLFSSKSISDLISRTQFIEKMASYDKKVIADIKAKQGELIKRKEVLQREEDKIVTLNKENETKISKLNADRVIQNNLAAEAQKQERFLAINVSTSQAQVNATLTQITEIRKAAPKVNLSRGPAPFSSNSVIAYATNFLGTPYLWGGTKPNTGFDCSGFTQYVYAHFGVRIGRTTFNQINDGVQVSKDQLQPGDLVFFGTWGNPSHMGIYAGNNTYIHSPRTGDVIKVSPMTRKDYVTGRRVK